MANDEYNPKLPTDEKQIAKYDATPPDDLGAMYDFDRSQARLMRAAIDHG
ncbi:MAG: hypothetical protein ACXADF_14965 [Candidatus Thorarchaeota archaeon]|jgi:hypothetical protein